MSSLKTLLVYPPQFALYSPFLSVPTLTACLREQGFSCDQWDLNLLVNRHFLSHDWLTRCVERGRRAPLGALTSKQAKSLADADRIIDQLPGALKDVKERENVLNDGLLNRCFQTIDEAYDLISAAHAPTEVSYNLKMRYAFDRFDDIEAAVRDDNENPYIELYREQFVPQIVKSDHDIVGVSITFEEQLVPALTLARAIKEKAPHIKVVGGGAWLTKSAQQLSSLGKLFSGLDFVVLYEGETPLCALIEHLEGKRPLETVPNLLHRKGADLVTNDMMVEKLEQLPPPDFTGFPLDDYLLPDLVLPLLTTRGCYWKKCAFCTHHHSYSGRYRTRAPAQLIEDIQIQRRRHGARHFYFVDEAIPPSTLKHLAEYGKSANGNGFRWFGDMRFERKLTDDAFCTDLYEGGCRLLIFGMESANQRVLDHMHKGVKVGTMSQALKALHRANITSVLMYFVGFPTETSQEAQETVRFIETHRDCVGGYGQGHFMLVQDSPVHAAPETYGLTSVAPAQNDLTTEHAYTTRSGLSQSAAAQISEAIERQRLLDDKFGQNWCREMILLRQSAKATEECSTNESAKKTKKSARSRWDAL